MHYMLVTSITLPLQAASNGRNYMHYMAHYMLSKMLMPCGYIDHWQPARARLGRMVTAGPSRPAEQPLRLSHNTKSQAPEPSSQSQGARRRWWPKSRRCDAGDDLAEAPQTAVDHHWVVM